VASAAFAPDAFDEDGTAEEGRGEGEGEGDAGTADVVDADDTGSKDAPAATDS
jgi:hypothetical protein